MAKNAASADPSAGAAALAPLIFRNLPASLSDAGLTWEPLRDDIDASWIYRTPDGASAAFLRYAPGARLGRHRHVGWEHILVLSGSQSDDSGEHQAGTLLVHPPGTSHTITSANGCLVLAVWEKPVLFIAEKIHEPQMKTDENR